MCLVTPPKSHLPLRLHKVLGEYSEKAVSGVVPVNFNYQHHGMHLYGEKPRMFNRFLFLFLKKKAGLKIHTTSVLHPEGGVSCISHPKFKFPLTHSPTCIGITLPPQFHQIPQLHSYISQESIILYETLNIKVNRPNKINLIMSWKCHSRIFITSTSSNTVCSVHSTGTENPQKCL